MNIVDRIDSLVKTSDVHSIKALEKELDFGNGTIGKWRKQSPSCDKVKAVADFLQTSIDYLVSGNVDSTEMSADEQELLENYRKSSRVDKARIQERAMTSAEHAQKFIESSVKPITVYEAEQDFIELALYDVPVSAGTGNFLDSSDAEMIKIPRTPDSETADYMVRVSGDSMEPRFVDGDVVLVKQVEQVEIGEIGIFVVNGDAFIKRFDKARLISLNPRYKPIVFKDGDTVHCIGRVIAVLNMKKGA